MFLRYPSFFIADSLFFYRDLRNYGITETKKEIHGFAKFIDSKNLAVKFSKKVSFVMFGHQTLYLEQGGGYPTNWRGKRWGSINIKLEHLH